MKRFISILMALLICCLTCISAFAYEAEPSQTPYQAVVEQVNADTSTRSLGTVIATNGGTIYNGTGSIFVTLPSGNFLADFVATIGYTPESGPINCRVISPEGRTYDLGLVSGSGNSTGSVQATYAPAGTYEFFFESAHSQPFEVACYIYD